MSNVVEQAAALGWKNKEAGRFPSWNPRQQAVDAAEYLRRNLKGQTVRLVMLNQDIRYTTVLSFHVEPAVAPGAGTERIQLANGITLERHFAPEDELTEPWWWKYQGRELLVNVEPLDWRAESDLEERRRRN